MQLIVKDALRIIYVHDAVSTPYQVISRAKFAAHARRLVVFAPGVTLLEKSTGIKVAVNPVLTGQILRRGAHFAHERGSALNAVGRQRRRPRCLLDPCVRNARKTATLRPLLTGIPLISGSSTRNTRPYIQLSTTSVQKSTQSSRLHSRTSSAQHRRKKPKIICSRRRTCFSGLCEMLSR